MFVCRKTKRFFAALCILHTLHITIIPSYAQKDAPIPSAAAEGEEVSTDTTESADSSKNVAALSSASALTASQDDELFSSPSAPAPEVMASTGSATYKIPIVVPPGRAGVAPSLALTYNSYQRNGWIGVGWQLDMGAIQRSTKRGINYKGDAFTATVNGASAELVARPEWGGGYYGLKIEGAFLKLYKDPNTNGWVATTKEGLKYYYGSTDASRQKKSATETFKWCLDKVEDQSGNAMDIFYWQDTTGKDIYLSRIEYTRNGALGAKYSVEFLLEDRLDYTANYSSAYAVSTRKRLKTITVKADGANVRSYELGYKQGYSVSSGRSILCSVVLRGSDGSTLPATAFDWQDGLNRFQADALWGTRSHTNTDVKSYQIADVDGDGKPEIVYNSDQNNGLDMRILKLSPSGTVSDQYWGTRDHMNEGYYQFWMADVDGDGKADMIYFGTGNNGRDVHVMRTMPDGTVRDEIWATRSQLCSSSMKGFRMADVNGDGLSDLIYNSETGNGRDVRVLFSNGKGFEEDAQPWGTRLYGCNTSLPFFVVADVNGDGMADLVYNAASGSGKNIKVLLSNGRGFKETLWGARSENMNTSLQTFQLADIDGDGKADFIYNADTNAGLNMNVLKGTKPFPDLLSKVTTSLGGTHAIEYIPSTAWPNPYDASITDALPPPFVLQTVRSISTDDGNGLVSTSQYSYEGGKHSLSEREFRGFAKMVQTYPNGSYTTTTFHQDDVKKGLVSSTAVNGADGVKFSETLNTYDVDETLFSYTSWPKLTRVDTLIYEGESSPKTFRADTGYDSCGNIAYRFQEGDISVSGDERYDYSIYSSSCYPSTLLKSFTAGVKNYTDPEQIGQADKIAETTFTYLPDTNLVATKSMWLAGGPSNPTVSYFYDSYGNLEREVAPNGNETLYGYDTETMTYRVSVRKPVDATLTLETTATYDYRFGKPASTTDLNGRTTSYTYDGFGRASMVVGPLDSTAYPTRSLEYGNFSSAQDRWVQSCQRIEHGEAASLCKSVHFDGLGREIKTESDGPANAGGPTTVATRTEYDTMGKVWRKYLPYFEGVESGTTRTELRYDALGRLTLAAYPDNTSSSVSYHRDSTDYIDPNGHMRAERKDGLGRLRAVQEYSGVYPACTLYATTAYDYDPLGNLTRVLDARGNETSITYNTLSQKTAMDDPDMGHWEYGYDPNGNLISQTDARGKRVEFAYDALNRMVLKDYLDPSEIDIVYHYDRYSDGTFGSDTKGRLAEVVDAVGATTFNYGAEGEVSESKKTIGTETYTVGFSYNAMGQKRSIAYPDSQLIEYEYDAGLLKSVKTGERVYALYSDFTAAGQAGRIEYGNGSQTIHTYNPLTNRLQTIETLKPGGDSIQYLSYDYDNVGNIVEITDGCPDSQDGINYNQSFEYDHLNRLRFAYHNDYPGGVLEYAYDETGNIVYNSRVGAFDYTGPHPHAVKAAGGMSYGYDENGNMVSRNGVEIDYDSDNRPSAVRRGGILLAEFIYDYTGKRTVKTTSAGSSLYVGGIVDITPTGTMKHIFGGTQRLSSIKVNDPPGEDETFYLHPDHLGSLNQVTKEGDTDVRQRIGYYPFGETRVESGTAGINYKYTGREYDPEAGLGLYYYGARYYDPVIGRFTTPDSIVQNPGDPQVLNRYSYCRNNPLIYTDPTGHVFGIDDLIVIGAGILIGAALSTTVAATQGHDLGTAALTGAISGGFFAGAGVLGTGLYPVVQAGIHVAAGAMSGAINAGITGGNVWKSAVISGVSAGVAKYAMAGILPNTSLYEEMGDLAGKWGQVGLEGATAVATGTVMGGFSSTMMGGSFGQGAELGAWTSAYGFMFNRMVTRLMHYGNTTRLVTMEVKDDGGATVTGEAGGLTSSSDAMARAYAGSYGAVFAGATGALAISLTPEVAAALYAYKIELVLFGGGVAEGLSPGPSAADNWIGFHGWYTGVATSQALSLFGINP